MPNDEHATEWLFVVFADDIFICAPPVIAAKLYAHIAYVAKKELNLVFKDEKTKFASMGDAEALTKSLKGAFSNVEKCTTEDFPLLSVDDESIAKFKVLRDGCSGSPRRHTGLSHCRVLRKSAQTRREWALAKSTSPVLKLVLTCFTTVYGLPSLI